MKLQSNMITECCRKVAYNGFGLGEVAEPEVK